MDPDTVQVMVRVVAVGVVTWRLLTGPGAAKVYDAQLISLCSYMSLQAKVEKGDLRI